MTARPWGLAGSLVSATLVHAVVLGTLGSAAPRAAESPRAGPTRVALRLIVPAPSGRDLAAEPPVATTAPVPAAGVPDDPSGEPGSAEVGQGWPDRTAQALPATAGPPDAWPDFIAAGQLSQPGSLADAVQIGFPDVDPSFGAYQVVLQLLIDDSGRLREIHPEDSTIDPAFMRAVNKAFGQARFNPGRVGDRPVRSRLRVRVTFDGTLLTAQHQSAD